MNHRLSCRLRAGALAIYGAMVAGLSPAQATEAPPAPGVVYVIPIHGMIEPALLYVIRRGVREAEAVNAKAVVFSMDTPGGTLNAAGEIVRLIQHVTIPTYTFVEKDAFSAGAIIALSTKHIYMAPGSVIGDAMPIMMSPFGGVQEMPEELQEKSVSAVSALVRAAAQESGHDPQLAEAMVRREIEYKVGDEVICPTGQLLTLTNIEAEREVGKEGEQHTLLSAGTVPDVDGLLDRVGLQGATVKELQVTSSERIARFIAALAPLFLMAGLLGIYIEIKTPGFGLPGILGIIALALFFWGHHIAGLAGMEDVVIFVIGLGLILVEIFLLPGFGIPGVLGLCLMLWSLLDAMSQKVPGGPWYPSLPELQVPLFKLSLGIVLTAIGAILFARFLPHSPMFSWLVLKQATSAQTGYTAAAPTADLLGAEGTAITELRPAGTAVIGDRRLDVVTRGGYVDSGTRVRVVEAHGRRVVVEAVEQTTTDKGTA